MCATLSARSRYVPSRTKCQHSSCASVASASPWMSCASLRIRWKNACGLRSATSGSAGLPRKRCSELSVSHISLEMRSRTWRAALRARSMHATIERGLSRLNASQCRTVRAASRSTATIASCAGSGPSFGAARAAAPSGPRASRGRRARRARGAGSRRSAGPRRARARRSGSSRTRPRRRGRASCVAPRASTQVSLPPPPCDEFTTSEPERSATRVSPPGVMRTSRPNSTNGRRSTCRPSRWSSTQQGCRDSASVGWAM